jgi:hypothetical protein
VTELAAQRQAEPEAKGPKPKAALNGARSFWLKQLHSWHWISAAVSLVGMILFAVTGITLNHAAAIPGTPVTVEQTATLPAPLVQRLARRPAAQPQSALTVPSARLNSLLASILELERCMISRFPMLGRFPGLSLFAVARAPDL